VPIIKFNLSSKKRINLSNNYLMTFQKYKPLIQIAKDVLNLVWKDSESVKHLTRKKYDSNKIFFLLNRVKIILNYYLKKNYFFHKNILLN
jgi:hypothetical protein